MGIETSIIEKYKEGFEKFQNYLYEIHSPYYQNKMHEGYFVDYKKFQDFEKLINDLAPEKQADETKMQAKIESNKISTVNLNEVNNQILNGNRYLIINNSMYELICKQNEPEKKNNKIVYKIITHYLEIYPEKGKIIQFTNNNTNIIDKTVIVGSVLNNNTNNNIINYSNNNQNINNTENMNNSIISIQAIETNADKIYLIMLKYFENENKIISILRDQKSEQMFQGFLVDKEWVDNWIKYSHYEAVNKEFFQTGKKDKLEIKKLLLKEINNNNLNNDLKKINDVDKFILKDVSQLGDALKNNKSYVILNKEFLSSYVNNVNVNPIEFYLSYQSIKVVIKERIYFFTFKTNDNILNLSKINSDQIGLNSQYQHQINQNSSLNNKQTNQNGNPQNLTSKGGQGNITTPMATPAPVPNPSQSGDKKGEPYNSQLLKYLIRFPYFKNELVSKNNSSQINQGYIIKKDIIKTLKEKYALKEIYNILQDNKILDGINYHNCDSNYQNIIQFLNDNNNGFLNGIKRIESNEIQYIFNPNDNFISKKFFNNNKQSKLIYLDEFEIIDKDFESHLKELYNNKLQILPIDYILIEGKIILSINAGQNAIYEIAYINPEGGDIIIEYLIEAPYSNNTPYGLNSSILQIFQKYGLNKIISFGKSFKEDNIIINLHKINGIIVNDSKINKNIVSQSNNQMIQGNQNIIPFPKDKHKYLSNSVLINESNYGNQIIKDQMQEGYLIDIEFFKFMENNLNLDNNEPYYSELFKRSNNDNVKNFPSKKIQSQILIINNKQLICPINFDIINKETFGKISKILNNKIPRYLYEKVDYISINDGFIFMPKNNNFLFYNNNYI